MPTNPLLAHKRFVGIVKVLQNNMTTASINLQDNTGTTALTYGI